MSNLLGPMDELLERPGVTFMDMLGEIEPDDLAVALGRHTALIDHLKASGEWDSLGCALCGLLVKNIGASNDGFRASLAASKILLSKTGVNFLWQHGALSLLLSGQHSLAPFYLNSQASLWCQTMLNMLIKESHKPFLKILQGGVDHLEFVTHLQSSAAVGLLVELAHHEFDSVKLKVKDEEKFSLKAVVNQLKSGLVGKRIDVEGMGVGLVVKFGSSRVRAGRHYIQFPNNVVKRVKLNRDGNGGAQFTIVEGGGDQSTQAAMVALSLQVDTAVHQLMSVVTSLVGSATSLVGEGKESGAPQEEGISGGVREHPEHTVSLYEGTEHTVSLYEGTAVFLRTLMMAFELPEEIVSFGSSPFGCPSASKDGPSAKKHQNQVLGCLMRPPNAHKIIACVIAERQITQSHPGLDVQWEAQELLLTMLNKSRDLLDEQVLSGDHGIDNIFITAQRLPGLVRSRLVQVLAPVLLVAPVLDGVRGDAQTMGTVARPKNQMGMLRTVVLCQQLFMSLWLHLPLKVVEVIGAAPALKLGASDPANAASEHINPITADLLTEPRRVDDVHSSSASLSGSWAGSSLDAWSGSKICTDGDGGGGGGGGGGAGSAGGVGGGDRLLSSIDGEGVEWRLGSTLAMRYGDTYEGCILGRADQAFHWRVNLAEELLRLSVVPALVQQLKIAAGAFGHPSCGMMLLRLQGALLSILEIRLWNMCTQDAVEGGTKGGEDAAVEEGDQTLEKGGAEKAGAAGRELESQKYFVTIVNELGRQCLVQLVEVLPSLVAIKGDSKAVVITLADAACRAMEGPVAVGAGERSAETSSCEGKQQQLTLLLAEAQEKLRADPNNSKLQAEFDVHTVDLAALEEEKQDSETVQTLELGGVDKVKAEHMLADVDGVLADQKAGVQATVGEQAWAEWAALTVSAQ
jgi:hypothetical protein